MEALFLDLPIFSIVFILLCWVSFCFPISAFKIFLNYFLSMAIMEDKLQTLLKNVAVFLFEVFKLFNGHIAILYLGTNFYVGEFILKVLFDNLQLFSE